MQMMLEEPEPPIAAMSGRPAHRTIEAEEPPFRPGSHDRRTGGPWAIVRWIPAQASLGFPADGGTGTQKKPSSLHGEGLQTDKGMFLVIAQFICICGAKHIRDDKRASLKTGTSAGGGNQHGSRFARGMAWTLLTSFV